MNGNTVNVFIAYTEMWNKFTKIIGVKLNRKHSLAMNIDKLFGV